MRVPYSAISAASGEVGWLPYLPVTLADQEQPVTAPGLVDSGSTVNVLPYSLGLTLGATWSDLDPAVPLGGNLAQFPAHPLVLSVTVGQFPPVRLIFAWTQADNVPLLLGQLNFFMEFDVCFFRTQRIFEVQPKQ